VGTGRSGESREEKRKNNNNKETRAYLLRPRRVCVILNRERRNG